MRSASRQVYCTDIDGKLTDHCLVGSTVEQGVIPVLRLNNWWIRPYSVSRVHVPVNRDEFSILDGQILRLLLRTHKYVRVSAQILVKRGGGCLGGPQNKEIGLSYLNNVQIYAYQILQI